VDGVEVSSVVGAADPDLSTPVPLLIDFGAYDYFRGCMSDVRLYRRALDAAEIAAIRS
jgi:hypothetical protein